MKTYTALEKISEALLNPEVRKATFYASPKFTVKATRRHKYGKRATREEVILTYGVPNYAERAFIKLCKKAGEPFPVKEVQLKFWSKGKKTV